MTHTVPHPDAEARARALFAIDSCNCCDCCTGYCPLDESEATYPDLLYALTVHGTDYIGTRFLVVRADLVALVDAPEPQHIGTPKDGTWPKPATQPPPATSWPRPDLLDRIDRAGLTLHDDPDHPTTLHLYHGDQHAGWTRPALPKTPGAAMATGADLPVLRAIATNAGISISQAAVALITVREAQWGGT